MSKKKKIQKKKVNGAPTKKPFNWIKLAKRTGIIASFLAVIFASLTAYGNKVKIEHDLSVVGNGKATVVQIHDPNCQLCQQLQSNVNGVKSEFKDRVQFKTANIKSDKGRQFAERFRVPHVTLLFFDGNGNHVNTLQGVTPEDDIRVALKTLR